MYNIYFFLWSFNFVYPLFAIAKQVLPLHIFDKNLSYSLFTGFYV